jgi:uncharacterized protein (DUF4415 family)
MPRAKGYTDADLAAVRDNPEWTADEIARAKPLAEVLPELAEALKNRESGGAKELLSLPLDRDVVDFFRSSGPGWQSRINEALRRAAKLP